MDGTGDLLDLNDDDQQSRSIARVWHRAVAVTAIIPHPAEVVIDRLTRQAAEARQLLLAEDASTTTAWLERARAIGRELVDLRLTSPQSLERSLAVLGRELPVGAPADPGIPARLGALLSGIAGGFSYAAQRVLLTQQEEINLAKTIALRQAREALADSLEVLAERNRQLSAEITERQRAEDDLRHYADRLESLQATHLAILSAESLEAILDLSIESINSLLSPLITSVLAYDLDAGTAEVLQSSWPHRYPPGAKLPITLWEMITQLQQGDTYYVEDARVSPVPSIGLRMIADVGGRSFLAVPLLYRDELIGAITMVLSSVQTFTTKELSIVREIANSAAVAVQHRFSLEAEQRAVARESTLREVTTSIAGGLELEAVLDTILEQLERVLPTVSSSIIFLEGDELAIKATRRTRTQKRLLDELMRHSSGNLMAITQNGRPEIIGDTHHHPGWVILPGGEDIRCWMGVPLIVKGSSIGILTLDRTEPNAFSQEELNLARVFANQAAIAIENARLFREVQLQARELDVRVRERTRELRALYGITAAAAEERELEDVLRQALKQALIAFNCPAGCIYLDAGEDPQLEPAIRLAVGENTLVEVILHIPVEELLAVRATLTDTPLIITDPVQLKERLEGMARAYAITAMRAHGRMLGLMSLISPQPDCFSIESLPVLTTIADQIATAVENIRLRHKARETAVLAERDRLARDLHDAVTQSLYSLSLFAEAAQESARANDPARIQRHLGSDMKMAQQALGELRLMLFELRADTAARQGLAQALGDRLKSVEERIGIAVDIQAESIGLLPVVVEEAFYRVGLEALNNALRHGPAPHVEVRLFTEDSHLVLTIADDGAGFDVAEATRSGGMGLNSMTQRLQQVGGTLVVDSSPGQGTRVTARTPLLTGGRATSQEVKHG